MAGTNQGMTFDDMVDAILQPKTSSTSDTLRCADLYCGDGEMSQAALDADLDVVYAYDPDEDVCEAYLDKFGHEPFSGSIGDSVQVAPEFDLLLVRLNANALTPSKRGRGKKNTPIQHAMEFIRARKPTGVLFVGEELSRQLLDDIWSTTYKEWERLNYNATCHIEGSLGAIVGAQSGEPFQWPWPSKMTPTSLLLSLKRSLLNCDG